MFAFLASQSTVGASPGYLPASLCGGQALNTTGCSNKTLKVWLKVILQDNFTALTSQILKIYWQGSYPRLRKSLQILCKILVFCVSKKQVNIRIYSEAQYYFASDTLKSGSQLHCAVNVNTESWTPCIEPSSTHHMLSLRLTSQTRGI